MYILSFNDLIEIIGIDSFLYVFILYQMSVIHGRKECQTHKALIYTQVIGLLCSYYRYFIKEQQKQQEPETLCRAVVLSKWDAYIIHDNLKIFAGVGFFFLNVSEMYNFSMSLALFYPFWESSDSCFWWFWVPVLDFFSGFWRAW